ncbi:MAG: dTDP-4-dehydrorhamnose reductase [Ilumatobacteraceae bacterium]
MRVLVTGAAGQLGADLVIHCEAAGDDVIAADRAVLDVADRSAVHGAISMLRPDVVVNTAAWTAVDACESDVDRADRVNALGPRWLREACSDARSHFVQISTDYVFDGTLGRPYREWDAPNPRSVYGASKLAGEREAGPDATVVRTSWVCGANGNNMVKTILRLLERRTSLAFVDDQRGCPTFTADLAVMVRQLAVDRRSGMHHVTNQGDVSWYEFVREVVAAAGRDPAMVEPITTADLDPPRPAPRPANSVLDNAALRLADIPLLRHHTEPLRDLVTELLG